jgi:hypothetical protein
VWDAQNRGLSVDYNGLAPWVFEGLRVFSAALENATRRERAHREAEKKVLGAG